MSDFFQSPGGSLKYDESKVPEVSFAQKIGLTYDGSGEDPSDRWGLKIAYYVLFVLLVVCMVNLWFENIRRPVLGAYVADCLLLLLLYFMFRPYMTFRLKFRGDPDPRLDLGFLLYVGGLFPALSCLFLAWHDDMLITLTNKAMFYSISLGFAGVLILLYFLLSLEKKKIYITILFMAFAVIFSLTSVYLLNYIFDMGAPQCYEITVADKKTAISHRSDAMHTYRYNSLVGKNGQRYHVDSLTYAFTEVGDTILVEHHSGVFGIGYDRVVIDQEANREQWIDAVSANYAEAIADNEQELIDAYRAENPSPEMSRLLDELQELVDQLRKEEVYTNQEEYRQILAEISEREERIQDIRSQTAE